MLIKTFGCAISGVEGIIISVEISLSKGNHFVLSGLPDLVIKESLARLESALRHSGFDMPTNSKITVNMAPADIKKTGSSFDLALAVGILAASRQIRPKLDLKNFVMAGELSLDGSVQRVTGALPIAIQAWKTSYSGLLIPRHNEREAAMVTKIPVYGIDTLSEAVDFLCEKKKLEPVVVNTREEFYNKQYDFEIDFKDVRGQMVAKRAMVVCASGGHNMLLIGPPGCGKSLLAKCLPTILPPLTLQEALETTLIHSVCGKLSNETSQLISRRPFRSPHVNASPAAILGGGSPPLPGEISLATNGVLYLDEVAEFNKTILEMMRQPLEDAKIMIARATRTLEYPARIVLIASMNPCPCGYFNHPDRQCVCSVAARRKYLNKISGPLIDRIDVQLEVKPISVYELSDEAIGESSHEMREQVLQARQIQTERFQHHETIHCNAQMLSPHIKKFCELNTDCKNLLATSMQKLKLSGRAYDRILKTSRTIADLAGMEKLAVEHVAEAISYRSLDREGWVEPGEAGSIKKRKKQY